MTPRQKSPITATVKTRVCKLCATLKPISDFAKEGMWYRHSCRSCRAVYHRLWHRREMSDPAGRDKLRKRWRLAYNKNGDYAPPDVRKARYDLHHAVRDGRIGPSKQCEQCGHDFSEFPRHAHHEDYAKPFDVAWLCSRCHGERHRVWP